MAQKNLVKKALSLVTDAQMPFPICVTYVNLPDHGCVLPVDNIMVPFTRSQLLFFIHEAIGMDELFAGLEITSVDVRNLVFDTVMRNYGDKFSSEIDTGMSMDILENYQYSWKYLVDAILAGTVTEANFDEYFDYFRKPKTTTVHCIDEWMDL